MILDSILDDIPEAFANDVIHDDQPGSSQMEVGAWVTNKKLELTRLAGLVQALGAQNLSFNVQQQAIASIKRQLLDHQVKINKAVALTYVRRYRDGRT